jgi:hypothetical protein
VRAGQIRGDRLFRYPYLLTMLGRVALVSYFPFNPISALIIGFCLALAAVSMLNRRDQ